MKADRHDAPEWIRSSSRKRGNLGVVIPGLIGTAITIGALHVASQAFLQGTVQTLAESKQQPYQLPRSVEQSPRRIGAKWSKSKQGETQCLNPKRNCLQAQKTPPLSKPYSMI